MKVKCTRNCKQRNEQGECIASCVTIGNNGCGAFIEIPEFEPMRADNVVIYDKTGIPSIMVRFSRVANRELFGGSCKVHPAFVINGEVYNEIYISAYPNCNINGKPYSLPFMKPWTNITQDDAAKACFRKGDGWHMMTAPERGLIANLCAKSGIFPHGNTDSGKYHANKEEKGETYDASGRTLTGSGPVTWTHDHTPFGIHDLCGNAWEMIRGCRIKNGRIEATDNNDAALDIDLTLEGDAWKPVLDDNGNVVTVSVNDDGKIKIGAGMGFGGGCAGNRWKDVEIACKSEQLKELALYAGEPETYCYIDAADGEYLPLCGGGWDDGSDAGVFYVNFYFVRSISDGSIGFRSAFFRKTGN